MGQRFNIHSEILIQLIERGTTEATQQAIRDINVNVNQNIEANRAASRATGQYRSSIRRLALDLRMVSIGLSILKREYGGMHPVIDATITSLYTFSAVVSTVIGTIGIAQRLMGFLASETAAAAKVIIGATIGLTGLAVIAGVIVGIGLGRWLGEQTSGIAGMRQEVRGLERDLQDLTSATRDLGVEQAALTAEGAAYSAQIRALKNEIEVQGYATDEQTARLKALEAGLTDVQIRSGFVRAEQSLLGFETTRTKDSIEDQREAIRDINRSMGEWLGAATGLGRGLPQAGLAPPYTGPPRAQIGGEVRRGGIVGVEAGEVIMQREQAATMMAGREGFGPISLSISLAGAHISGVSDLEGTLQRGGERAREELRKLNLQRHRGRSRF